MRFTLLPLGWRYIGMVALVTAAAFNTGSNPLYMVAALMLGLFILSGVLSDMMLWQVEVESADPGEFYAGEPGPLWVRLKNKNPLFAVYGLNVNGEPFPVIPRGSGRAAPVRMAFPKRGYADLPALSVESRFPFGFIARRRILHAAGRALIYPAIRTEKPPQTHPKHRMGERERAASDGDQREYRSLKPYQEGDDPRHINWKKSAQRGILIAAEFDRKSRGHVELYLNTRTLEAAAFEEDVTAAAAAACRWLRHGHSVSLATPDIRLPSGAGDAQRRHLLSFLAVVRMAP
jgi:uncharacterized protein (DUF58 family)